MTVQMIIKRAIKRLELEGKILTPDYYAEAFCKEASKSGMMVEDCNHIEKLSSMLNKDLRKELKQYRIRTMHELVRFLISKLNRTNPSNRSSILESQDILIKRVLQVIGVLHNKEASDLANTSIELLGSNPTSSQIDSLRQHWVNFITTYDDSFLKSLNGLGKIDSSDLKKSIENLEIKQNIEISNEPKIDLEKLSSLLVSSLVPSISSSVNEDIATVSTKIKENPLSINNELTVDEIKSAISLRIALDKASVKEMVSSLDGVLNDLSSKLIGMIEKSNTSTVEIQKVKTELETYSEKTSTNFKLAHKKLYTIASALEKNTQLLSKDLKGHGGEVNSLALRVRELEDELAKTKEESKEDFLTKLYNKRALDEFMKIKEAEFDRYEHNYSIVMFDIDFFKKVNDNYGHDAGDAVLSALAKILKKESRTVDVVGRFGGEEFMALLSETGVKGAVVFAEKVRKHVEKARFMYKGQRIKVTISSGVSERKQHTSLKNLINSSDEYLYQAKKDGRNRVGYKRI